jgi:hypothetical protein
VVVTGVLTGILCAHAGASPAVAISTADAGTVLGTLTRDSEPLTLAYPGAALSLSLHASAPDGVTVARLEGDAANPAACMAVRETTSTQPFHFGLTPPTEASTCSYQINYWADSWKWKGRLAFSLAWVETSGDSSEVTQDVPRTVVLDAGMCTEIATLTRDKNTLALPLPGKTLLLRSHAPVGVTTSRIESEAGNPPGCEPLRQTSSTPPFEFTVAPPVDASDCAYRINYWKPHWDWETRMNVRLAWSGATGDGSSADNDGGGSGGSGDGGPGDAPPVVPGGERYDFTVGSLGGTSYTVGRAGSRGGHGNRIYCTISHFSWDDPIIYPGEPGRAHLHMFWGNTGTAAASTGDSIRFTGGSSCEGGTEYRSGAWTPALFNDRDEVVIPEQTYIYYKTFGGPDMRFDLLQVVPQGLEMLASADTLNYSSGSISHRWQSKDGESMLNFLIHFPSCVATVDGTRTGTPILRFQDMAGDASGLVNSHVAYPGGPDSNEVGCPASHPYRFPTPSFLLFYRATEVGNTPYLSSDGDAEPLSTLHGDYIFGVAPKVNERILRCVIEARSCGFEGGRGQLPERFYSAEGVQLYRNSVRLYDSTDRTPFDALLIPMKRGHGGHSH